MKSDQTLADEAKHVLADEEHVIWHALSRRKAELVDDLLRASSLEEREALHRTIRELEAPRQALRALANRQPRLEAVSG